MTTTSREPGVSQPIPGQGTFTLFDRRVAVPPPLVEQPPLYAMCRAWVRNDPSIPLVVGSPEQKAPDERGSAANAAQQVSSDLPPPLPPTELELETRAPAYPMDDFEAQEPEEALRKLKDHWVEVRHYHQAMQQAKKMRYKDRLSMLFGHQQQAQAPAAPGALGADAGMRFAAGPAPLDLHSGHPSAGAVPAASPEAPGALPPLQAVAMPASGPDAHGMPLQQRQQALLPPQQQPAELLHGLNAGPSSGMHAGNPAPSDVPAASEGPASHEGPAATDHQLDNAGAALPNGPAAAGPAAATADAMDTTQ